MKLLQIKKLMAYAIDENFDDDVVEYLMKANIDSVKEDTNFIIDRMHRVGNVTVLDKLKEHGITPKQVQQLKRAGVSNINIKDLNEIDFLRRCYSDQVKACDEIRNIKNCSLHSAIYLIDALNSKGFTELSSRDINVTIKDKLLEYGFSQMVLNKIDIRIQNLNINVLKEIDFEKRIFTSQAKLLNEIIDFTDASVISAKYLISSLRPVGFTFNGSLKNDR